MLELPQTEYEQLVPAGLVFTGGSSNLSGIDALARDMIKLPVRVGSPTNLPRYPRIFTRSGLCHCSWSGTLGSKE